MVFPEANLFKHPVNRCLGVVVHSILSSACHVEEDVGKLFHVIVVEVYGLGESALESWVGVDEVVHLLCISSHYAHKLSPVVFQSFQQCVDGLGAERVLVA